LRPLLRHTGLSFSLQLCELRVSSCEVLRYTYFNQYNRKACHCIDLFFLLVLSWLLYKIPCYLICFIKYIQIVTKSLIPNPPFLSIFYNPICNLHSKKMMQNAWENIQLFFIVHLFYFILTLMWGCRSMRISNVNNGNFYDNLLYFCAFVVL